MHTDRHGSPHDGIKNKTENASKARKTLKAKFFCQFQKRKKRKQDLYSKIKFRAINLKFTR